MFFMLKALNFDHFVQIGLPTMLVGMVGIFAVIGTIILIVWAMGKITNDKTFSKGLKNLFGKK